MSLLLIVLSSSNDKSYLKSSIRQLDENAFVIVTDATEVYGKGFKHI